MATPLQRCHRQEVKAHTHQISHTTLLTIMYRVLLREQQVKWSEEGRERVRERERVVVHLESTAVFV